MEHLAPDDLVDDASELSTESLASGSRLGRYELLLAIAYGGMARVWAARQLGQRGFSKTVAIKTILPHLSHSPEFEKMFLDEARIAAGVHHPNVTEIYELGEEGQVLYLAMEWVNGDSLAHVLRPTGAAAPIPIDARVAARVVADACAGLHSAHELCDDSGRLLNVVHRDVSPHNILLALDGTVKVTDFGVARALGQTHQATVAGQVKGKVAYMAPEQIGGTPFDRRADIFGMGCLLYEATTGLRPFRGEGDPQVMQAVLRGTYDAPGRILSGYPNELAAIIDRALAPEPRARFATAERMRVALEEWLARGGVVTGTQVGSLVKTRLGAVLDRRREQIRAATAILHGPDPTSNPGTALGHTPSSGSRPGSHSGVVPMQMGASGPMSSHPNPMPPPLPGRALPASGPTTQRAPTGVSPFSAQPPPMPRPGAAQPPVAAFGVPFGGQQAGPPFGPAPGAPFAGGAAGAPAFAGRPFVAAPPGFAAPPPQMNAPAPAYGGAPARPTAPSGTGYALAAVGGVVAAAVMGCLAVGGWAMLRASHATPAASVSPAELAATASAAPSPPGTASASAPTSAPSPALPAPAPEPPAPPAASAADEATTVVAPAPEPPPPPAAAPPSTPPPRPVFVAPAPPRIAAPTTPPAAPARPAPRPAALPANPY